MSIDNDDVFAPPSPNAPDAPSALGEPTSLELGYTVTVDNFSGPLDLLLYLVRRTELDILEVPLALIVDQFIETVQSWQDTDLDSAGDFILMAATLLEMKARTIVPPEIVDEQTDRDEPVFDPRDGLLRSLLTYRKFKEAIGIIEQLESAHATRCERQMREMVPDVPPDDSDFELGDIDIHMVMTTCERVLSRINGLGPRTVIVDEMPLSTRLMTLMDELRVSEKTTIKQLLAAHYSRIAHITTIMASLELARQRLLEIAQRLQFDDIELRLRSAEERERAAELPPEEIDNGKRKKKIPLVTFTAPVALSQSISDDADERDENEEIVESDEQRFIRELEETTNVSNVLARTANVEKSFIEHWYTLHPELMPKIVAPEPVVPAADPADSANKTDKAAEKIVEKSTEKISKKKAPTADAQKIAAPAEPIAPAEPAAPAEISVSLAVAESTPTTEIPSAEIITAADATVIAAAQPVTPEPVITAVVPTEIIPEPTTPLTSVTETTEAIQATAEVAAEFAAEIAAEVAAEITRAETVTAAEITEPSASPVSEEIAEEIPAAISPPLAEPTDGIINQAVDPVSDVAEIPPRAQIETPVVVPPETPPPVINTYDRDERLVPVDELAYAQPVVEPDNSADIIASDDPAAVNACLNQHTQPTNDWQQVDDSDEQSDDSDELASDDVALVNAALLAAERPAWQNTNATDDKIITTPAPLIAEIAEAVGASAHAVTPEFTPSPSISESDMLAATVAATVAATAASAAAQYDDDQAEELLRADRAEETALIEAATEAAPLAGEAATIFSDDPHYDRSGENAAEDDVPVAGDASLAWDADDELDAAPEPTTSFPQPRALHNNEQNNAPHSEDTAPVSDGASTEFVEDVAYAEPDEPSAEELITPLITAQANALARDDDVSQTDDALPEFNYAAEALADDETDTRSSSDAEPDDNAVNLSSADAASADASWADEASADQASADQASADQARTATLPEQPNVNDSHLVAAAAEPVAETKTPPPSPSILMPVAFDAFAHESSAAHTNESVEQSAEPIGREEIAEEIPSESSEQIAAKTDTAISDKLFVSAQTNEEPLIEPPGPPPAAQAPPPEPPLSPHKSPPIPLASANKPLSQTKPVKSAQPRSATKPMSTPPKSNLWPLIALFCAINAAWGLWTWLNYVPKNVVEIVRAPVSDNAELTGRPTLRWLFNIDVVDEKYLALPPALVPTIQPAVSGRWYWENKRTLTFEPAADLPMATNFTATLNHHDWSSSSGFSLAHAHTCTWTTPALSVTEQRIETFSRAGTTVALTFNQTVNPATIVQALAIELTNDNSAALSTELPADSSATTPDTASTRSNTSATPAQKPHIKLLSSEPSATVRVLIHDAPRSAATLRLAAGTTGIAGPRGLINAWETPIHLQQSLSLTAAAANVATHGPITVAVQVNNHAAPRSVIATRIRVEPEIPVTLTTTENGLALNGEFIPGETYTIHSQAAWPEDFESEGRLPLSAYSADSSVKITIPARPAGIWADNTLLNNGQLTLNARAISHAQATITTANTAANSSDILATQDVTWTNEQPATIALATLSENLPVGAYRLRIEPVGEKAYEQEFAVEELSVAPEQLIKALHKLGAALIAGEINPYSTVRVVR
jgi:segregation and condensation protein A